MHAMNNTKDSIFSKEISLRKNSHFEAFD